MCRINNMLVRSATELMAGQKKPNAAMMVAVLRASLQVLDAMHGGLAGKSRRDAESLPLVDCGGSLARRGER